MYTLADKKIKTKGSGFSKKRGNANAVIDGADVLNFPPKTTHSLSNVSLYPKTPVQTKLTVNTPGDSYEREADSVADKVMRSPDPAQIQRKCDSCEDEDKKIQRKPASVGISPLAPAKGGRFASPVLSNRIAASQGSGGCMDAHTQSFMSDRFGVDFGGVKIHSDAESAQMSRELNARAFTSGNNIYFNSGEYDPSSDKGKHLLAHELTHVVQQDSNSKNGMIQRDGPGDAQADAKDAADAQRQKGLFFDRLRAASPSTDTALKAEIASRFAENTDDRWLADTIYKNGPEPLWPLTDMQERQKRAMANSWAPEPGNIEGKLGSGTHTVQAFYFRGVSDRRALIIGGVHGSEPGGVEVVHDLLTLMQSPNAPMPFFSVIIVPELFSANVHSSRPLGDRRASGGKTKQDDGKGHAVDVDTPDPNRQFPAVGKDVTTNTLLGCQEDEQHRCIEPENVVLIDLINRFQPERIANIHGHGTETDKKELKTKGGASITTDPRPGHEVEDDALTLSMAKEANKLGVRVPANFIGDPDQTTRYPNSTAPRMSKGVSLGEWGSHATPTRPAMNVVLVETFGNTTSNSASLGAAKQAARKTELMNLAQILNTFFLADPSVVNPNPGPAKTP